MGDRPDFNDLVIDDPAAAWQACGRARTYRPELGIDDSAPLQILDFTAWQGRVIPERQWIVDGWVPKGHVTSLYGDGGAGKSLLAQQLLTACAIGRSWLGLKTTRCRAFGVFAEDEEDELVRRQAAINAHYGIDFRDLGDLRAMSRVGEDALLITFGRNGEPILTDFFVQLLDAALAFDAQLLVIDTAADAFGGDENRRGEVRAFLKTGLGALACRLGGAVVLCAHPSRGGLASGEGDGGNTAWSNGVRSRLYLARPQNNEGGGDSNGRILSRKKANYAGITDEIKLSYRDGVFHAQTPMTGVLGAIEKRNAETVFLETLDRATAAARHLSDSPNSGNYAPRIIAQMATDSGFKKRDFEQAMHRLFAVGAIRIVESGPPSRTIRWIERVVA